MHTFKQQVASAALTALIAALSVGVVLFTGHGAGLITAISADESNAGLRGLISVGILAAGLLVAAQQIMLRVVIFRKPRS